jgi:hypothetical protein
MPGWPPAEALGPSLVPGVVEPRSEQLAAGGMLGVGLVRVAHRADHEPIGGVGDDPPPCRRPIGAIDRAGRRAASDQAK